MIFDLREEEWTTKWSSILCYSPYICLYPQFPKIPALQKLVFICHRQVHFSFHFLSEEGKSGRHTVSSRRRFIIFRFGSLFELRPRKYIRYMMFSFLHFTVTSLGMFKEILTITWSVSMSFPNPRPLKRTKASKNICTIYRESKFEM